MSTISCSKYVYTSLRAFIVVFTLSLSILGCQSIEQISFGQLPSSVIGTNGRSISADGRYVVFTQVNLVSTFPELEFRGDVYVRDILEGTTTRVSKNATGGDPNGNSWKGVISNDGRFVAFESYASNIVTGDTNHGLDVFVHDRQTDTTTRVSVDSAGNESNAIEGPAFYESAPALSADGRYIAFTSTASNLVANDTNDLQDGFVHDRVTGVTTRFNVDSAGNQALGGNIPARFPSISDSGRYISFGSSATNLVPNDTNNAEDIFVRDRDTGVTTNVHVNSAGEQGTNPVFGGGSISSISGDGRYVAFYSNAENLVANDTNEFGDVFVHDRQTGITTRVNLDSAGNEANNSGGHPSISGDGRYVAFSSRATNMVANDTNNYRDIFVHDRVKQNTWRVSTSAAGDQGDGQSVNSALSADGRSVVFYSGAKNLVSTSSPSNGAVFFKAITEVTVNSITPNQLPVGMSTSVTVTGTNFLSGVTPIINGAQLSNIVVVDENTMTMDVAIEPGAATGSNSVMMLLPGTGPGYTKGSAGICQNCVQFF